MLRLRQLSELRLEATLWTCSGFVESDQIKYLAFRSKAMARQPCLGRLPNFRMTHRELFVPLGGLPWGRFRLSAE
jgi:hypothetical protein